MMKIEILRNISSFDELTGALLSELGGGDNVLYIL